MSQQRRLWVAIDRFLFESCDPTICSVMRIGHAALLIICTIVWMIDRDLWFTDAGMLTARSAAALNHGQQQSLFFWFPSSPWLVQASLAILFVQCWLLLLGCWSRFQIACIFFWLVSFQHRNPLICDGEDTVFRLFSFMMIWMPLDHRWSLLRWRFGWPQSTAGFEHAWALRLVQFEMTAIYASNAWSKFQGQTWRDGTAIYYVGQMTDMFGRGWLPAWMFESEWFVHQATWGVLVCEMVLPIALWLRPTRRIAIGLGIALHLAIEYSMNLFLFEWIMIVGLMAFLTPNSNKRVARGAAGDDARAP
ncbi:MAG: HTTM domain-containing protein [Pirellulaceae bacterium]|nr:HTTM domain-containing protein [Pirellulaceae bacterium]